MASEPHHSGPESTARKWVPKENCSLCRRCKLPFILDTAQQTAHGKGLSVSQRQAARLGNLLHAAIRAEVDSATLLGNNGCNPTRVLPNLKLSSLEDAHPPGSIAAIPTTDSIQLCWRETDDLTDRVIIDDRPWCCLVSDDQILTLGTVVQQPRRSTTHCWTVSVRVSFDTNMDFIARAITGDLDCERIRLVELKSPVCRMLPALESLQNNQCALSLHDELIDLNRDSLFEGNPDKIQTVIQALRQDDTETIEQILNVQGPCSANRFMDWGSRSEDILQALCQRVSFLDEKDDTEQSSIFEILMKLLYECSDEKILVIVSSKDKLDMLRTRLTESHIPPAVVRQIHPRRTYSVEYLYQDQMSIDDPLFAIRHGIDALRIQSHGLRKEFRRCVGVLQAPLEVDETVEYFRHSTEYTKYLNAFSAAEIPKNASSGDNASASTSFHSLLRRWSTNETLDDLQFEAADEHKEIWQEEPASRERMRHQWQSDIRKEYTAKLESLLQEYETCQRALDQCAIEQETQSTGVQDSRILLCTAVDMPPCIPQISHLRAGTVFVQDAHNIDKALLLSALPPTTSRLILIGDADKFGSSFLPQTDSVDGESTPNFCLFGQSLTEEHTLTRNTPRRRVTALNRNSGDSEDAQNQVSAEEEEPEKTEEMEKDQSPDKNNPEDGSDQVQDPEEADHSKPVESEASKDGEDDEDQDGFPTLSSTAEDMSHESLKTICQMAGLKDLRQQMISLDNEVKLKRFYKVDLSRELWGAAFVGNPGSGRHRVSSLYIDFLHSLDIVEEETSLRISYNSRTYLEDILEKADSSFNDSEYYTSHLPSSPGEYRKVALVEEADRASVAELEDFVTAADHRKIIAVFIGTPKLLSLLDSSTILKHRGISRQFTLADYTPDEMLEILQTTINRDFDGKMQVEGGFDGPLMRQVARRVCRKNTGGGCGNMLGLRAELSTILERARRRLAQDKNGTSQIDPYFLNKDDLSGPDTEDRLVKSAAWEKLQRMVGLEDVKERVRLLHHRVRDNFERDEQGQSLLPINLNGVFLGPPGTGKTTVAKLYGQILVDLDLLSEGKVIEKTPADLLGQYIGDSEKHTREAIKSAEGNVMIIDDAHMLWMGSKDKVDSFRYGIIDTIVGCVPGNGRANQCVLLVGYKNEMEEMFRNANPGLSRRFQFSSAFHFRPYSIAALERILELKLEEYHLSASYDARLAASMLFRHAITSPQFGNAAYVEEIIQSAQASLAERYLSDSSIDRNQLEPQDFPTDWDRALKAEEECQRLFEGVVGCSPIISQLLEDTKVARNCFLRNIDARSYIPFHYVFKGPPGTGKTTTARKMGQIFYHMGILSSTEVVECSVTDMIGSYVGQTGPKTLALLEKAVGKVLFIDEAYRLYDQSVSGREFATDAIGELVGALTSTRFQNSLVIILAGYGPGMEALLSSNPGLRSRFKRVMTFENMDGVACTQLLINTLRQHGVDTAPLETPSCEAAQQELYDLFTSLSMLDGWGNARDVITMSERIFRAIMINCHETDPLVANMDIVTTTVRTMIATRGGRPPVSPPPYSSLI